MATREALSKTLRFEIFKRDKFTCQYCGASAPDVILEVDHIEPVSKGGTNDIFNLVTSCRDCNRGKKNRKLSDNSTVKIQKQRLDEMQERMEQLKMMMEWRESLINEVETQVDSLDSILCSQTSCRFSDFGRNNVRKLVKKFGYNNVCDALQISIDQYYDGSDNSCEKIMNKLGGICYNRQKWGEQNAKQDS